LPRLKAKDGFDRVGASARHIARRGAMRVDLEATWTGAAGMGCKLAQHSIAAADGPDLPSQREHIPPMALGMKHRVEASAVCGCERAVELRQPILRNGRDAVCSREHGRCPSASDEPVGLD
jgi:hypothetical protein